MKEWFIRLLCVILGASIMFGTLKLQAYVDRIREHELVVEEVTPVEIVEDIPEEEVDPNQLYEEEAEHMYQEMIEQKTDEDTATVGETTEVIIEAEPVDPTSIEAAPVKWIKDYPMINSNVSLEEKMSARSSYDETMATNAFDKLVLDNSKVDFSEVKIAIMGDSLTAGSNLSDDERSKYNWPAQLKEILGCKEVVNLGIGGSTISKCSDSFPMCERWQEIPEDIDIMIIMGGSNDALFENKWQFGELEYEHRMTEATFCGDLDAMLGAIKWVRENNGLKYCKRIFINPPSTILNDGVYALNPENMVKQERFAEAINEIAPAYGFEVIDLFNNNFLNSHDSDINSQYVYDGIHCNKEGYRILAEHIASQIIQRIEQ